MYIDINKLNVQENILNEYKEILLKRAIYGIEAYKNINPLAALSIENHYLDKSTGTLREMVTLWISKAEEYNPPKGCPAYDGIRYKPIHHLKKKQEFIETKPVIYYKRAGTGCINDHSLSRHEQFIKDNLILQGSSFYEGQLGFIFEFPYRDIKEHMETQIQKTKNSRCVGKFSFINWYDKSVKLTYLNKTVLEKNKNNISGGGFKNPTVPRLYHWLMDHNEILVNFS